MDHDVYADKAGRGECDECHCEAVTLYRVICEAGCFDGCGSWEYCGTCAVKIIRNHAVRYEVAG